MISGQVSHFFEHYGNSLSHTNAHGTKRVSATGPLQLVNRSHNEARSAGAQWMSDRDGAAFIQTSLAGHETSNTANLLVWSYQTRA